MCGSIVYIQSPTIENRRGKRRRKKERKKEDRNHRCKIYTVSQKGDHPNHGYNFVNSRWICKILSMLQRELNFKQNSYYVTHYTLSMLLHYLEKLKNQKFALCMRVNMFEVWLFHHHHHHHQNNLLWRHSTGAQQRLTNSTVHTM